MLPLFVTFWGETIARNVCLVEIGRLGGPYAGKKIPPILTIGKPFFQDGRPMGVLGVCYCQ